MPPSVQTLGASAYRGDIDGLRAVSVLLVVGFHAGVTPLAGGYVGVDVFFVISGYLVTGILVRSVLEHDHISLRDFYARRIRRLLPLSATVLLTTLLVGLWALPPLGRRGLLGDATGAALYVANWRFAGQATAYSDHAVTDGLLLHYWSLSIEEQFYLLWPLLIVAAAALVRRRPHRFVPVVTGLLVLVVGGSFAASVVLTSRLGPEAYYLTHTRLWEMGAGALLALGLPRLRPLAPRLAGAVAGGGLAAIAVAALTYDAETPYPGYLALVPTLGAVAVIAAGARSRNRFGQALGIRPLRYLGRLSYAWYLWHWPVIGLALLTRDRLEVDAGDQVVIAVAVVVSLGLSALSHRFVENPLRHAPWLEAATWRNLAFGFALTALPVVAVVAFSVLGDTGRSALEVGADAMTPVEASEDVVSVGPEDCHADQHSVAPSLPCAFGDLEARSTVALVGDSHARHWLPALDAVAADRGWRLLSLTKSACTPFDVTTWNENFEREYVECEAWRRAVIDHLADLDDLELVIVSQSSGQRGAVVDEGERDLDDRRFARTWGEGAARSFARLTDAADHVVVLRDTYWSPEDVPGCLSANTDDPSACALTRAEHGNRDEPMFDATAAVAPPEVSFLDPRPLVCSDDPCAMVTADGIIKYRDRHHLTETFSLQLADELGRAIDEVRNR